MKEADSDKNGKLGYKEFKEVIQMAQERAKNKST